MYLGFEEFAVQCVLEGKSNVPDQPVNVTPVSKMQNFQVVQKTVAAPFDVQRSKLNSS